MMWYQTGQSGNSPERPKGADGNPQVIKLDRITPALKAITAPSSLDAELRQLK